MLNCVKTEFLSAIKKEEIAKMLIGGLTKNEKEISKNPSNYTVSDNDSYNYRSV
jgi:hypothetical protein